MLSECYVTKNHLITELLSLDGLYPHCTTFVLTHTTVLAVLQSEASSGPGVQSASSKLSSLPTYCFPTAAADYRTQPLTVTELKLFLWQQRFQKPENSKNILHLSLIYNPLKNTFIKYCIQHCTMCTVTVQCTV